MGAIQSMLSADAFGSRISIGSEPIHDLRCLSDARALQCPLCGAVVVLKAGSILAPHFAHLPGAVCSHHDAEPETARHREGKTLLARWAALRLPDARVTLEAIIAETGQRADLLVATPDGTGVALEYQCADLSGRDWRRRHEAYASAGILDLWVLGGNRLVHGEAGYKLSELERELTAAGKPLLFLDSLGESLPAGHVARIRLAEVNGAWASGKVSLRPLDDLEFPWSLLQRATDSASAPAPPAAPANRGSAAAPREGSQPDSTEGGARIWRWLTLKYRVTEETAAALFGMDVEGADAFGCTPRAWQAAVYYRWIHGRVGEGWWLEQVNVWARKHLPLAIPTGRRALRALAGFQELLSAAGLLSLPHADGRARVEADLTTLGRSPEPAEVLRLASYRRTLRRDR